MVITPDRSLVFPSVEYVRNMISKAGVKQGASSIPVVIDSRHVQGADFTAAKVNLLKIDFNGGLSAFDVSTSLRFSTKNSTLKNRLFFQLSIFFDLQGVKSLIDDFVKRNQPLLFYNLKPSVVEVFQAVQPVSFSHCSSEQELYTMLRGTYRTEFSKILSYFFPA